MNAVAESSDAWSTPNRGGKQLAPAHDRLMTTLFFAALLHGVIILGVTFGSALTPSHGMPAMEVLLLTEPSTNDQLNPNAAYLAQRNERGSGTTEAAVKPGSPPSSLLPTNLLGLPDGNGVEWHEALLGTQAVDLVTSLSRHSDPATRNGINNPASAEETPLALMYTMPSPVIATTIDKTLTLRGKIIHEIEISPDTRESRIAPYLDGWRRKVERLAAVKFPMISQFHDLQLNPEIEVVMRADGSIAHIIVRRSSGQKELDQAAIGILKLAAPFDAFPPGLHSEFDQLRFAYEWQFNGGHLQGTVKVKP